MSRVLPVWRGTCPGCRAVTTTHGAVPIVAGKYTRDMTINCPNCDHEVEMHGQLVEERDRPNNGWSAGQV